MEEKIEMSLLLDYYGVLLTEKQKYVMNLYCNEDFSLAEISEYTKTSRQAIYDLVKRCSKLLLDYEGKLKLMKKYMNLQKIKKNILNKLEYIEENCKEKDLIENIEDIKQELLII